MYKVGSKYSYASLGLPKDTHVIGDKFKLSKHYEGGYYLLELEVCQSEIIYPTKMVKILSVEKITSGSCCKNEPPAQVKPGWPVHAVYCPCSGIGTKDQCTCGLEPPSHSRSCPVYKDPKTSWTNCNCMKDGKPIHHKLCCTTDKEVLTCICRKIRGYGCKIEHLETCAIISEGRNECTCAKTKYQGFRVGFDGKKPGKTSAALTGKHKDNCSLKFMGDAENCACNCTENNCCNYPGKKIHATWCMIWKPEEYTIGQREISIVCNCINNLGEVLHHKDCRSKSMIASDCPCRYSPLIEEPSKICKPQETSHTHPIKTAAQLYIEKLIIKKKKELKSLEDLL